MESFVHIAVDSPFPLENLPYGVCRRRDASGGSWRQHACVALGDHVVDLSVLSAAGCFSGPVLSQVDCFNRATLNAFLELGPTAWQEARTTLTRLLSMQEGLLRDNTDLRHQAIVPMGDVDLLLPALVGDYTDFYASRYHAYNVGSMFRGPQNALQPNWVHLPVGYHGRSSSIIPSGVPVRRPWGQVLKAGATEPVFQPSDAVDFELEVAAVMGTGNDLGAPIPIASARSHIFGLLLMNDWSARDLQKWEYVPLGPFTAKNWATQVSPWLVTLAALEPWACEGPPQDPEVLPYLRQPRHCAAWDVQLEVALRPGGWDVGAPITRSNLRHLYWSFEQMVAHHTAGGCPMRPGDLLGSGTVSGPGEGQRACLLELTWGGSRPLQLQRPAQAHPMGSMGGGEAAAGGEDLQMQRRYLEDGDEVVMRGWCEARPGVRGIGFGECRGQLLAARQPPHQLAAG